MLHDVVILEHSDDDVHTATPIRDDDETIAQVNFITHTVFSHPAMVEEGIRE